MSWVLYSDDANCQSIELFKDDIICKSYHFNECFLVLSGINLEVFPFLKPRPSQMFLWALDKTLFHYILHCLREQR